MFLYDLALKFRQPSLPALLASITAPEIQAWAAYFEAAAERRQEQQDQARMEAELDASARGSLAEMQHRTGRR